MNIAVTGPLGHIGSQLIRELPISISAEKVLLLDDLSTQRYCSLFNLPKTTNYQFIESNILDADLESLFSGMDVVIHLAAITNASESFNSKDLVHKVNFEGTKRVANACLKNGAHLYFVSTTSVYGVQESVVDENCPLSGLKPQSPYADSKLKAELYIQQLVEEKNLRATTFRFGTIFGTSVGMRFHTAINKFCWQAVIKQPITVWKTAMDQFRPYLDLKDAVRLFDFAIRGYLKPGLYNAVTINTSVKAILDEIRKYLPSINVEFVDSKIMNQLSYNVESLKVTSQGFKFSGNLPTGIHETISLIQQSNSTRGI